jgi:addiction module HigA family antidote
MNLPTHRPPIHPSEILQAEFMQPYHLTPQMLAQATGIPIQEINDILEYQKPITAETALRLSCVFGTSAELWLNGQMQWDIWHILHSEKSSELKMLQPIHLS